MVSQSKERFSPKDRIVGRRDDSDPVIRLEIYGLLVLGFAIALVLALITFNGADISPAAKGRASAAHNLIGPIGAQVAHLFLSILGVGAFVLALGFGYFGLSYLIGRRARVTKLDVVGWLGLLLAGAVLAHVFFAPSRVLDHLPGGDTGAYLGEISASLISSLGTMILFGLVFIISLVAVTRRSIFELAHLVTSSFSRAGRWIRSIFEHGDERELAVATARGAVEVDPVELDAGEVATAPQPPADGAGASDGPKISEPVRPAPTPAAHAPKPAAHKTRPAAPARPSATPAAPAPPVIEDSGPPIRERADARAAERPDTEPDLGPVIVEPAPSAEAERTALTTEIDNAITDAFAENVHEVEVEAPAETTGASSADSDLKITESPAMRRRGDLVVGEQLPLATADAVEEAPYEFPSVSFLDYRPPETASYDRDLLRRNAQILEEKLADYRVKGKVVEIHPGPVITMYEFRPAPGVKVSAIANLENDLAMALSALRIRIVAPIPGKDVVGIEVPNSSREIVWLKEVINDPQFKKAKSKLTLALGKDIVGNPCVMNLQKAPHLLVAGATGAGKSVAINSFIVSLLYQAKPEDVRLILVDPKMLELSIYEGIPHLLLPVVTDPKQAAIALRWAVKEMERRYKLMADMGVRNLSNYNAKVDSLLADPDQRLPERLRMAKLKRQAQGEVDPPGEIFDADGKAIERLPLIVVIIDELADLMMVASKEVEHSIARLAQMARASGIHMVLATQRPSVDVITGLIKANFPTRISFQVASGIDSRTILDRKGAENLLGMGDMLFLPPGTSAVQRVHGSFVSEEEVHQVVRHLKEQGEPNYDLGILAHDDEDSTFNGGGDDADEFYDRAVKIVAETRNASISFLQRKLKIGYNRSARIVEMMEDQGIIGPSDGTSRPREVFIEPI